MKKLLVVAVIFAVMSQAALALNTHGGIQVKCPAGQQIYVGSNGHVSCIKSGLLGASNPILGPGGTQRGVPGRNGGGLQSAQSRCQASGGTWFSYSNYCCPKGAVC